MMREHIGKALRVHRRRNDAEECSRRRFDWPAEKKSAPNGGPADVQAIAAAGRRVPVTGTIRKRDATDGQVVACDNALVGIDEQQQ